MYRHINVYLKAIIYNHYDCIQLKECVYLHSFRNCNHILHVSVDVDIVWK